MKLNAWKEYLEELVDPDDIDVASLKQKEQLNSDFWKSDKLNSKISEVLYSIAKEFFQSLKLDPEVKMDDVTLTGSLSSYNWSKVSDVDLHILIDFKKLQDPDLVQDYFRQKTSNWNHKHKILIKGHEVELYIQDSSEPHHALGVYSIKEDHWVQKPSKYNARVDYEAVKKKASDLMERIDDIYENFTEKKYSKARKLADRLMDKIRNYRRSGLEKDGVYSVENLVFKTLRRNDYIKKLSSLRIMSYDKSRSINGGH